MHSVSFVNTSNYVNPEQQIIHDMNLCKILMLSYQRTTEVLVIIKGKI